MRAAARIQKVLALHFPAIFLCVALPASADYLFDSWTTSNGLPQNTVYGMAQTPDGYIWLSTPNGLARFDGLRFQIFNRSNTPQLTTNRLFHMAMFVDSRGALWVGTNGGGVVRYYQGAFRAYSARDGLPFDAVYRIDEDSEGTIWIFGVGGLATWRDGRLTCIAPQPGSPFNAYIRPAPSQLGYDAFRFGLWRRGQNGWERFAYGKWQTLPLPPSVKDPEHLRINSISEDSKRRLWYSELSAPTYYFGVENGRLTIFHGVRPGQYFCYQDRKGGLWGSDNYGHVVRLMNGKEEQIKGFSTPWVFRALEDRDGTLWFGTVKGGLYRARESWISMLPLPGSPELNKGIKAVLKDHAGNIWIGGFGLFQLKNRGFESYLDSCCRSRFDFGNIVMAIYEEPDGSILTGTFAGAKRLFHNHLVADGLFSQIRRGIEVILRDRAGDLWLGGESLFKIHGQSLTQYSTRDGWTGDTIIVMYEDRSGAIWIGGKYGLTRYEKGVFRAISAADGFAAKNINSLYEDLCGVLWVGTHDEGLLRLERGKWTHYTTENGLPNNAVFQIFDDGQGYFWIACNIGIYRVKQSQLNDFAADHNVPITPARFGVTDGLLSTDLSAEGTPNGFKDQDGKLWFITAGGLAIVDPAKAVLHESPPPVVVEELRVNGQPVKFENGVVAGPGRTNLEIQYTAPAFIQSDQIRFRYKLRSLDSDWTNAGTRRTAYYTDVPAGKYRFQVIAANSDGVWNTTGASIPVQVLSPFYATTWFLVLAAIGVTGLGFLAWWRQVSQWRRTQLLQQAFSRQLIASQESERKRIAAELHDSLGQRLLIMKSLALLQMQALEKNGTRAQQLEEISAEASRALNEVREISYDLRPYQLDRLGLTKAIEAVVATAASASQTAFAAEIDDIDDLVPEESRINLYRIVQECLNNILKHAEATQVSVAVKREAEGVRFAIRDNGKGFAMPGALQAEAGLNGFGLRGIAERVQLLGGRSAVSSAPGKGTEINIEFSKRGLRNGK